MKQIKIISMLAVLAAGTSGRLAAQTTATGSDQEFIHALGDAASEVAPLARKVASESEEKVLPNELLYGGRSVEFPQTQAEIYALAAKTVLPRLASQEGDWAIVLDVDDTVLNTSEIRIESGKGFLDLSVWNEWVAKRRGTAVPGAKEFLDQVRAVIRDQHGRGRIVFITDRSVAQEKDTVGNLSALGLFDPETDQILATKDKTDNKAVRRRCVEQGGLGGDARCAAWRPAEIVALFGDSFRDFIELYGPGVFDEGRLQLESCVKESRCFVIPNPMYGQWLPQGAAGPYEHFKPLPTR